VSEAKRQIGGQNNRQGNRYEDGFAVFRSIELAPYVIHDRLSVRLSEQAGCPVDDLLIRQGSQSHYYQLKDDLQITWGRDEGKLRKEFVAQKTHCTDQKQDFTLSVVVSHDHRKQSLDEHMPDELRGTVTVYHFPAVRRPSELAKRAALQEPLRRISASRSPGRELLQGLAQGFHLAWVEQEPDKDGAADLGRMVAFLRERPSFRVYRPLSEPIHPEWDRFLEILAGIPGLSYHYDRGYLEWSCGRESGLVEQPCDSESFCRFVNRVLEKQPNTFETFEELLP
jgi:hypothetical protein